MFLRRLVPFVAPHGHYSELFVAVHPKLNKSSHFKVATVVSGRAFGLIVCLVQIKKKTESPENTCTPATLF